MDPPSLCVPHLHTHTHARIPSHAYSRKRPLCANAGHNAVARAISGHSSPFSASHEWHGNRLSITHAHSRDRDTWRENTVVRRRESQRMRAMMRPRRASIGWGEGKGGCSWKRCSLRVLLYVPASTSERSRMRGRGGDLRLLSLKRTADPPLRVTHGENYVADDPSTGNFQD